MAWFEAHSWITASVEHEGSVMGSRVNVIVMLEFGHREEVGPVILAFIDKYSEELVEFLIDPFSLAIRLWVPCCG